MQFLLTEEEYNKLKNKPCIVENEMNKIIMDLCIKVSDYMPIEGWHATAYDENMKEIPGSVKPWGCFKTNTGNYSWYCDGCPVRNVCPEPNKLWSK